MTSEMRETTNMAEDVNAPDEQMTALPSPLNTGRRVSDEEAEADFEGFTRGLGIDPKDW